MILHKEIKALLREVGSKTDIFEFCTHLNQDIKHVISTR